jgi:hypothetical protein
LREATVLARLPGGREKRITANAAGEYSMTVAPLSVCDFFVTTGERSAYRLGVAIGAEPVKQIDWTLWEVEGAAPWLVDSPRATGTESGFPLGTVATTVISDAQGHFTFPNVKPGAYQVRAQIPTDARGSRAGELFTWRWNCRRRNGRGWRPWIFAWRRSRRNVGKFGRCWTGCRRAASGASNSRRTERLESTPTAVCLDLKGEIFSI